MAKNKQEKAVVTQDNRFIFAKYDMNANELKFFMWIIAQINSQKDQLFQVCEIPVREIFSVFNQKSLDNYSYIRNLCESMLKKTYVEDFRLLDEKTMKLVRVFQGYTLFDYIKYQEGEAVIHYKLNDFLMQYLLNLKGNFTQIKFSDIQRMKSSYSIRIYNMLLSELKQNKQTFEISLAVLHNILETTKSVQEKWSNFKKVVIDQTIKDINAKSNIILFEVQPIKEGKKIVALKFFFDYKGNENRVKREKKKSERYFNFLASELSSLFGKSIYFGKHKIFKTLPISHLKKLIVYTLTQKEDSITLVVQDKENEKFYMLNNINSLRQVTAIKRCIEDATENFYSDQDNIKVLQSLFS